MLDQWLEEDIREFFKTQNFDRAVVVDTGNDISDILKEISKGMKAIYFSVDDEISELRIKFEVEQNLSAKKVIIHSTRPLDEMKFCREYAATGGCISENLARYIRRKLNCNIQLSDKELVAAGRRSVGKGEKYWQNICVGGEEAIFSATDLLDFLLDPVGFEKRNKKSMEVFLTQVSKYSFYDTKDKPVKTIAKELANSILSSIISQECENYFKDIYNQWFQNRKYEKSFLQYVKNFPEDFNDVDFTTLNPDHPFKKLDRKCLDLILQSYLDGSAEESIKKFVKQRENSDVSALIGTNWWFDVDNLFFERLPEITKIENLDHFITAYREVLWKLDSAHRHLYSSFINEKDVTDKIQLIYTRKMKPYLKKWFEYFKLEYQENQSNLIKNNLACNGSPIAFIVGDAISLSIANEIRERLDPSIISSLDVVRSDYPSETFNNMSALFSCGGEVLETRGEREKRLKSSVKCDVNFDELEKYWGMKSPDSHLILYSDDLDKLGHTGEKALKYFEKFIESVVSKIPLILNAGFSEVHLVSDHGFIIYGDLSEADKTVDTLPAVKEKKERYILTYEKIEKIGSGWNSVQKPDGRFIYYKESFSPFKTTGEYSFGHGGMTPQELLTPHLICTREEKDAAKKIKVTIFNKSQLGGIAGENVLVKIRGEPSVEGTRRVEIHLKGDEDLDKSSDIITIEAGQEIVREFRVSQSNFKILLLDANTKETLDSIAIRKQSSRDLGGLL